MNFEERWWSGGGLVLSGGWIPVHEVAELLLIRSTQIREAGHPWVKVTQTGRRPHRLELCPMRWLPEHSSIFGSASHPKRPGR